MRLFISVNFDRDTMQKIIAVQNKLKEYAKGSFSRPENIHLTLVFIGEVPPAKLEIIKHTMSKITVPKMELIFDNIGYFKRNGGDIWWIGLNNNSKLIRLQKELTKELINSGFKLEQRTYRPHITIARRVKPYEKVDENTIMNTTFTTNVDSISLMQSNRISGKLTYSELLKVSAET